MTFLKTESPRRQTLAWSVAGMDCGGCAAKIRRALERLPGVSEVSVSVVSQSLSLTLDDQAPSPAEIEERVRRLGYEVSCRSGQEEEHAAAGSVSIGAESERRRAPTPWFAGTRGRLVILTGALLAAAWALEILAPGAAGSWGFFAACVIGLIPVSRRALSACSAGQPFTIEMLMTIAATGALVIGAAEEAALVVFLFAVGEVLEGVAAERARASIRALGALVPRTARLVDAGTVREVLAAELRIGQIVLVRPGDRIPADGEIVDGSSEVDESPVTGESIPVAKHPGDTVFAGSINAEAALTLRVAKAPEDNTIARIIRLVEEAQDARAPTERFIDRFSRYYMPVVVGLAMLVAVVPPLALGQEWTIWTYRALALLLIGCPCALVISVPASIASALSAGARRGLLLKGGAVIENAARTTLVAFDKTGTLTAARPTVTDVEPLAAGGDEVLALAAAVEAGSSHPLAAAIGSAATAQGVRLPAARAQVAVPGRGMRAEVEGRTVTVGSPRYAVSEGVLSDAAQGRAASLEAEGKTVVVVFREGSALGLVALRDQPREDAGRAVRALRQLGVRSLMLTGDNGRTAAAIAGAIGIEHRAELLPDGKLAAIRDLAAAERVMMVGDGINDAPALAAAHVGVAMGSGTDVALETADGALLRDRVSDVPATIRLARATMANIRQNVTIALGLKGLFLVTTVAGLTGLWPAILADTGATVLVTLNALRLLGCDPERERCSRD